MNKQALKFHSIIKKKAWSSSDNVFSCFLSFQEKPYSSPDRKDDCKDVVKNSVYRKQTQYDKKILEVNKQ